MNRTSKPIPQELGAEYNRYGIQIRQNRPAILGDGKGNIAVIANPDNNGTEHYGRYWIQLAVGNDNGGNTQYGEGQKARVREFLNFEERQGLPLRVFQDGRNGEWVIESIDTDKLIAANVNPISYNFFRILNSLWARMFRDGRVFVPNQLNSGNTIYTVESYLMLWHTDRQFYEHGRGVSDNLDLASYIPSAGNERLVMIAFREYEKDYEVIAGATRTIASTPFDLTYLNTMAIELSDMAQPKACVRLQNAQTTVTLEDVRIYLQQIFDAIKPDGFPMTISVKKTIITGNQQLIFGSLIIDSVLKLDGEIIEL